MENSSDFVFSTNLVFPFIFRSASNLDGFYK